MHGEKDELNAAIGKTYYANMCMQKKERHSKVQTKKCHHQATGKSSIRSLSAFMELCLSHSFDLLPHHTYLECFKNFVVYAYLSSEKSYLQSFIALHAISLHFTSISSFSVFELNSLKQFHEK